MFPVETLPPPYLEERAAAEAAKKLAEQQKAAALSATAQAPSAAQQVSRSQQAHALYHSPLAQPGATSSTTVLGGIFQGFMKRTSSTPGFAAGSGTSSAVDSATPSRTQTPVEKDAEQRREAEAVLLAQIKNDKRARDLDLCAWPGWH